MPPVGRPFQPGQSGNPGGRKKSDEVRALAREFTAESIQTLADICRNPKATAPARVAAATALLDRGWGKPTQAVTVHKSPLEDLSADELQQIVAALAEDEGGDQG